MSHPTPSYNTQLHHINTLSYRELQAACRAAKLSIRLNSPATTLRQALISDINMAVIAAMFDSLTASTANLKPIKQRINSYQPIKLSGKSYLMPTKGTTQGKPIGSQLVTAR